MLNFLKQFLHPSFLLGGRSPRWRTVRRQHLKKHPKCACCNTTKRLQVHHKTPFHLDKDLELSPENLITLCKPCHFLLGHLKNWKSYNKNIRLDAERMLIKIINRP